MKILTLALTLILGALTMTANAAPQPTTLKDPENTLILQLKDGEVAIQMFPEQAPLHVARIKELTREGYYNGKLWHRVIDGFMAQTGSPNGDGIGGSTKPDLKAEFNGISHIRGVASMASTAMPNSANAQFFIMLASNPGLDGNYTAWGQVVSGMDHVDNIKKGTLGNGMVASPADTIIKATIASDKK